MHRLVAACLLGLCLILPAGAQPLLRIATVDNQDSLVAVVSQIMREAYRRIGYQTEIERLPSLRSLAMSNAGQFDAELGRVAGIEKEYTGLLRVATPILSYHAITAALTPHIQPKGWQDLKPLRIGALRGAKRVEMMLAGMDVHYTNTLDSLLSMLLARRIDVMVSVDLDIPALNAQMQRRKDLPPDTLLHFSQVEQVTLYHYVHQRNARLLAPLEQTLTAMHKEGFIEQAFRAASQPNSAH